MHNTAKIFSKIAVYTKFIIKQILSYEKIFVNYIQKGIIELDEGFFSTEVLDNEKEFERLLYSGFGLPQK